MRKIVHLPDSSFYSELISALEFDNNTLIYNELTDEMFRFVKPTNTNQTFESWKGHIPKYVYSHFGNIIGHLTFEELSGSYELYNESDIFSSDLTSKFMKETKVYWQKKIGGSNDDYGYGIAVDGNANVYVTGFQQSDIYGGTYDYGVIKLDSNGNLLWQKKIGGSSVDQGYGIAVDGSGNIYLNGTQGSDVYGGSYDYGVLKLDTNGNVLWQKKIGSGGQDYGQGICIDGSGNVYLNGYQSSDIYGGTFEYGVVKLDTNGNLLWQKKIGGIGTDYGDGIAVDGNGNVYLNGYQTTSVNGGAFDYGVVKLDNNGNMLWQKKIGGSSIDEGQEICVDGSGNVYLIGFQGSDTYGDYDYGVLKLDTNGNILWQKKIGGSGNDTGRKICVDGSGNVYLNGLQNSSTYGSYDYGVLKLDTNGNLLWQKKIGGSGSETGQGICVDGSGNVYVNGYQTSDSYGSYDYGIMKLYGDQESDMNMSIGNMNLSIGNMSLSIGNMNLYIGNMSLSVGDMNLSIGDVDLSGDTGGLVYIG